MPPKGSKKAPAKRKAEEQPAEQPEEKAAKTDAADDPIKTIKWLLSDEALELIVDDEVGKKGERSYRSTPGELSAFEELVCCMLLAKPISHRLGLRSIRTLLNEPHSLDTPGQVLDAGVDKIYEALEQAKTQHKDKTADQLVKAAQTLVDDHGEDKDDGSLSKIREEAGKDAKAEREIISKAIKGIGNLAIGALSCFTASWPELYPFADKRTLQALTAFNLPSASAKELADLIEKHWDELKDSKVGSGDHQKAATFATVLDRAIAIELDKKGGRALNALAEAKDE